MGCEKKEGVEGSRVVGMDRDDRVREVGKEVERKYGKERFCFVNSLFSSVKEKVGEVLGEGGQVDGLLLDLGFSSRQVEEAERGFSFKKTHSAKLNMQMGLNQTDAFTIINSISEEELARVIFEFGGESHSLSRNIARHICKVREKRGKIETSGELAEIVRKTGGVNPYKTTDPATSTFQALRILTNDELNQLSHALLSSETLLREGGVLVVLSYHSLEDRIVKKFINWVTRRKKRTQISKIQTFSNFLKHSICLLPSSNPFPFNLSSFTLFKLPLLVSSKFFNHFLQFKKVPGLNLEEQEAIKPTFYSRQVKKENEFFTAEEWEVESNPRSRSSILRYCVRNSETKLISPLLVPHIFHLQKRIFLSNNQQKPQNSKNTELELKESNHSKKANSINSIN